MTEKSLSRRNFIRSNAIAGIGLSGLAGLSGFAEDNFRPASSVKVKTPIKALAGLNPQQLHDRYHDELFKRFLPAMESLCIDNEYGGFMCDVDIAERKLINTIKRVWNQGRGIWVYSFLYTNFESTYALQRVLPYLRKLNDLHLLVVVFFENTEITATTSSNIEVLEDIYTQITAEQYALAKIQIAQQLKHAGIITILTQAENLTVSSINKYLELKSRGMI